MKSPRSVTCAKKKVHIQSEMSIYTHYSALQTERYNSFKKNKLLAKDFAISRKQTLAPADSRGFLHGVAGFMKFFTHLMSSKSKPIRKQDSHETMFAFARNFQGVGNRTAILGADDLSIEDRRRIIRKSCFN